jgi:hypothetical protein
MMMPFNEEYTDTELQRHEGCKLGSMMIESSEKA